MVRGQKKDVHRGDIFLINFDPAIGSEIKKVRPGIVLQNDVGNEYSPVTIVAALTSFHKNQKLYPTEVIIPKKESGLDRDSVALLNQIRTIDKERLVKKLGKVSREYLKDVNKALAISLNLIDL